MLYFRNRSNNLNPDGETTNGFNFFGDWSVNDRTVEWHGGTNEWMDEGVTVKYGYRGGIGSDHVYFKDSDTWIEWLYVHWYSGYISFQFSENPKGILIDCGSSGQYYDWGMITTRYGNLSLADTNIGDIDTCDDEGCHKVHRECENLSGFQYTFEIKGYYNKYVRFYAMIGKMKDLSETSPNVSFYGRGNITLLAKSTITIPTVTLIDSGGNNSIIEAKEKKTITISPDKYRYEKSGNERDGFTYTVRVDCANCSVSNLKQITYTTGCIYPIPTPPANSRYVNFFQNSGGKPVRSPSDLIAYGSYESSSLANTGIEYSNDFGSWVTKESSFRYNFDSAAHHFYYKDIRGDFFFAVESMNSEPRILGLYSYLERKDSVTEFAGLYRIFRTPDIQRSDIFDTIDIMKRQNISGFPNQYLSGTEITDVDCKMSYGGFTLPLNYALYQNGYQHISNDGHLVEYPDDALKNVTADACSKLKAAYSNARIYVIKYKTDYDPYDSCGATITERADTEEEMKTVLSKIAKDIKNYASYKDSVIEDETNSE